MPPLGTTLALLWIWAIAVQSVPVDTPDYKHNEQNPNAPNVDSSIVSCPNGYTAGVDKSGAKYCLFCGDPSKNQLGCGDCGPGQSCDAYAESVCEPFDTNKGRKTSDCIGSRDRDTTIFPIPQPDDGLNGIGKGYPIECHTGGNSREMRALSYTDGNSSTIRGRTFSDGCGFGLNNCVNGTYSGAKIYLMDLGDSSMGRLIQNDNFQNFASAAIKYERSGYCH